MIHKTPRLSMSSSQQRHIRCSTFHILLLGVLHSIVSTLSYTQHSKQMETYRRAGLARALVATLAVSAAVEHGGRDDIEHIEGSIGFVRVVCS